ncbi:trypsin-like peptidase domain-containing protein [Streptomyces anandii]|uniref:trypsin-like peptidase domain-containing protein n=1 Tax=Streptomyces anandii TaxID=285454 RepID=UPI0036F69C0D
MARAGGTPPGPVVDHGEPGAPWRIRVLGVRGPEAAGSARVSAAGAAVLVSERLALTCAHVVEQALGLLGPLPEAPGGSLPVDFPALSRDGSTVTARVAPGGWLRSPPAGDLAVLALDGPLPPGARPAPLDGSPPASDVRVRAYGHPAAIPDGLWARARTVGTGGPQARWLQLDGFTGQGTRIERGFSGAGVWDEERGKVIGVVASVLDGSGPATTRVAWMIPLGPLAGTDFAALIGGVPRGWNHAPGPAAAEGGAKADPWDVVEALLATGVAAADGGRGLLTLVPGHITGGMLRDDRTRLQMFHLVSRCGDFTDGPAALVRAVRRLEGDSIPVREFVERARALWPDRLGHDV